MTAPGGDHGEEYRAHADQPQPWEQYPHPPVDPQAPVNYPEFAPPYPPQPPYPLQPPPGPGYGYPAAPPGGPLGYGGPPPYPGPYDPYQVYQASSYRTNGLAIASLITSIVGIPLSFLCYLGLPTRHRRHSARHRLAQPDQSDPSAGPRARHRRHRDRLGHRDAAAGLDRGSGCTSPDVHRGLIPHPVGGTNRSDCRSMPAARPFAAITNAILRLASSSISSPSITAPRAPPAADVCHS